MTEPNCRPFRMSDAMILIAATALGLGEARSVFPELGRSPWVVSVSEMVIALLPVWSITFVVLRLRDPKPAWEALRREPGFVACMAGGLPSAILHLVYVLLTASGVVSDGRIYALGTLLGSISVSGFWLKMWNDKSWKPQPGWLDRCGIILGFVWVAILNAPCVLCGFYSLLAK